MSLAVSVIGFIACVKGVRRGSTGHRYGAIFFGLGVLTFVWSILGDTVPLELMRGLRTVALTALAIGFIVTIPKGAQLD